VEELLAKYRLELEERVLPFWLRHTLDRKHGGYFNCVDRFGEVYDTRKHVWMQGRGAWMFARLYTEYQAREEYKDAAGSIMRFVDGHARAGEPRCWFSLTAEGVPAGFQRKPYAAFFVALAKAEYSKISKDASHLAEAIELFWRIEEWVRKPELLGRPVLAGGLAYTQLADLYVLAWLAWELSLLHADGRYERVIGECVERLLAHYDPRLRVLRENAGEGLEAYPEGRLICPGSSLEVCWLFLKILEKRPDGTIEQMLLDAILGALEFGWDEEYGGLYYFRDAAGRPETALESNMKLWWPHTEAILACAVAYKKSKDERYLAWWRRVDEYAFRTFADAEYGEWFGYCDRRGEVATGMKGGAYKGIFHVPRFLLFTLREFACRQPVE
jgi:N-acylglucosamine 2-epimerase